jgi:hypothetical protein
MQDYYSNRGSHSDLYCINKVPVETMHGSFNNQGFLQQPHDSSCNQDFKIMCFNGHLSPGSRKFSISAFRKKGLNVQEFFPHMYSFTYWAVLVSLDIRSIPKRFLGFAAVSFLPLYNVFVLSVSVAFCPSSGKEITKPRLQISVIWLSPTASGGKVFAQLLRSRIENKFSLRESVTCYNCC